MSLLKWLCVVALIAIPSGAAAEGRYIVQFRDGARGKAALKAAGGETVVELGPQNAVAARLPDQALAALQHNPHVASIEEDVPRYPLAQVAPYGVLMVQARKADGSADGALPSGFPTGSGRKICVIDSGIDASHPDLSGLSMTGEPAGWNRDACGHGTHVAGTLAALDNTTGVVGVSPGAVRLHFVQVFTGSSCSWTYASDLIAAANRCKAAGANVISMSLGGSKSSSAESQAFADLYGKSGILLVAAAGNRGTTAIDYPAGYSSVISVGAVDENYKLASFSQRNKDVELVAPGVNVLSTLPGGKYLSASGTSMAVPHVSAVAAVIWSRNPGWSNKHIRAALRASALRRGTGVPNDSYGYGIVQAQDALKWLLDPKNDSTIVP